MKVKQWVGFVIILCICFISGGKVHAAPAAILSVEQYSDVYDAGDILKYSVENKIDKLIFDLDIKTGMGFFVVTVPSLEGMTIESYADELFDMLDFGEKGKAYGMLLLISKRDKQVHLKVGDSLESFLPEEKRKRILDEYFIPYRDKGQYDEATKSTAEIIVSLVRNEYQMSLEDVSQIGANAIGYNWYVHDKGNSLNYDVEVEIDDTIGDLSWQVGIGFVVVTVPGLSGMTIESYADSLFDMLDILDIPKKGKDYGILLLISKNNNEVYLKVGDSLESFLPEAKRKRILDEYFIPYRDKDEYDEATKSTAEVIAKLVGNEYQKSLEDVFQRGINGIGRNSYVTDKGNSLNYYVEQEIDSKLVSLDQETGSRFFVVTVPGFSGMTIESYADALCDMLVFGEEGEDYGILLLISKNNNEVYLKVGDGLEDFLPETKRKRILDEYFVPYRDKDQYDEATELTVRVVVKLLKNEYLARNAKQGKEGSSNQSTYTEYVYDSGDVLNYDVEQEIDNMLIRLDVETGAEFAVVIVNRIRGTLIEDRAMTLYDSLDLGKEGEDNGILLLVATDQNDVYCEVGSALRNSLTDAKCESILNNYFPPAQDQGQYDEAVKLTVQAISAVVNSEYQNREKSFLGEMRDILPYVVVALIVIIILLISFARFFVGSCNCGGDRGDGFGGGISGGGGDDSK